jgi:hypothetical protein
MSTYILDGGLLGDFTGIYWKSKYLQRPIRVYNFKKVE